jgi:antitoxin component YwqK of YwqJK toxin-antitoxin module
MTNNLKPITILILSLLIFQSAQAQKDTLLYYMKNDGEIVEQKAAADYFALIVKPAAGEELFPVYEFYPNGKRKMIAASKVPSIDYQLDGTCMYFFQNGRRKAVITYKDGVPVGDETEYYPNGKVYTISKFDGFKRLVMECRDSTGNVLAQNGEGKWLKFDPDFKQVIGEGPIAKGKQNGEWQETQGDSIKRIIVYSKSTVKSGVSYKGGKAYPFKEAIVKPDGKDFSKLSAIVTNYDKSLKNATPPGVNEIIFMVDIDGSISEPKIIKSMSPELGQLLVYELKTGPKWKPGLDYGIPTRMQGSYISEIRTQGVERSYMIAVPAGSPPPQVGDKVRRQ